MTVATSPRGVKRGRFLLRADEHANVAVVIVTYNSAADIPVLIDDLRIAAHYCAIRLVIVDNNSGDGTADIVRAHDDIRLIESGRNAGYAGGINAGLPFTGPCDAVMILNPDVALAPNTVSRLLSAADTDRIGAVVPLLLDGNGETYPSLRREPTLTRALGDALFGSRMWLNRPSFLSESSFRPADYTAAHDVDWATGAALLVSSEVLRAVGQWNEQFFLYSEETDYFRRIRKTGRRIRFEPSAVVTHRGAGSGESPMLAILMAVNRIRYAQLHHGRIYSALFRVIVAVAELLRSYDRTHRRTLAVVLNRKRWQQLPRAG